MDTGHVVHFTGSENSSWLQRGAGFVLDPTSVVPEHGWCWWCRHSEGSVGLTGEAAWQCLARLTTKARGKF